MLYIDKDLFSYCGVYCIINTVNQKRYVGSSINCYLRTMDHRAELRSGVHANPHLQSAFKKYGEDAFVFELLEKCEPDKRIEREKFYIDLLHPEYNLVLDPVKVVHSEETRQRMSEARKLGFKRGTVVAYQKIPVHKYDLNGNYICSYSSLKEACMLNGITESMMNRYFKENYTHCHNFMWSKIKVEKLPPHKKRKRNCEWNYKPVVVKNILTTETQEFKSISECAKYFNVTQGVIGHVIKQKNIYKKQYMIYSKTGV